MIAAPGRRVLPLSVTALKRRPSFPSRRAEGAQDL